ncbi:MAG: c-type cytochrome [Bryobacteraceae bacterium]
MVSQRTPEVHKDAQLQGLDYGGRFTAPGTKGTIVFPGFSGAEWGGQAYDPETHLFYVNANEMPWILRLVPPSSIRRTSRASAIYRSRCASCHGADRKGAPPEYPAVDNLVGRVTETQLMSVLHKGSGRMPAFATLGDPALKVLSDYLFDRGDKEAVVERGPKPLVDLKYISDGYHKFLDADDYPGITPPWGTLSAINLDTGEYAWKIPLGEYPELKDKEKQAWKTTAVALSLQGDLFFIGATPHDQKFRAFDKKTGKLLWETKAPPWRQRYSSNV